MNRSYMKAALQEAVKASATGDVPVGAVVVKDGKIIGTGFNKREACQDPTAHAEMLAIREAAESLGSWRLTGASLYVTLEPCPMCAGAIINARIQKLVFGAYDPKAGAVVSLMGLLYDERFNHAVEVYDGICHDQCSGLLRRFFQGLRCDDADNSER